MSRRARRQQKTFAEVVREAKVSAPEAEVACRPGAHGDGLFVDLEGHQYGLTDPEIDAPTAQRSAAGGALIVWDECGCGGYCGYEWLDREQAHQLAKVMPRIRNTKKRHGRIALYTDDRGRELLLVERAVAWGSKIS